MNQLSKLILFLLIPFYAFGQEKEFYDLDNSYHWIYKKSKVKSLKAFTEEYDENGNVKEKNLELIQKFAKNGDIVYEREYYSSDTTDGWEVKYKYNKKHQTIRTEWTWLDNNSKELTEYEYDSGNKLIKSCDYRKSENEKSYSLENCDVYLYKKEVLNKVISSNDSLLFSYKNINGIISKFDAKNKLISKYKNGELLYRAYDSTSYTYYRNSIGQLVKSVGMDDKKNILNQTEFEYTKGLLKKISSKDKLGKLKYIELYSYEYFE